MPLDPQTRAYLDAVAALGGPSGRLAPTEMRDNGLARSRHFAGPEPAIKQVEDRTIPGPDGDVPVRIYTPDAAGPLPIFVYIHGGGWVAGSIESTDHQCRAIANMTPCVVVSVDYRLAPETKFPGGLEDCYAALVWAAEHGAEIGGDPSRLAVGGGSAGGNLALAVSLLARDHNGPKISYQMLVYPVTDNDFERPSYTDLATGYGLTRDGMQYFWELYCANESDADSPYMAVLRADLAGLPPALVITAEFDPLRDEGDALAEKLSAAGVPVEHICYEGVIHGFFNVGTMVTIGDVAVEAAAKSMAAALVTSANPVAAT
jgi:acetyl esterase